MRRLLWTAGVAIVLAVVLPVGLFARLWVLDEVPPAKSVRWLDGDEGQLGDLVRLEATLILPWHRSLAVGPPSRTPTALLPALHSLNVERGALSLFGQREWRVVVSLVIVNPRLQLGERLSLSLDEGRLGSPRTADLTLPALKVTVPVDRTDVLVASTEPLEVPEPVEPNVEPDAAAAADRLPWLQFAGLASLLFAALQLVARALRTRPVYPWAEANAALDRLAAENGIEPSSYIASMMDIVRGYLDIRFGMPARASTTDEIKGVLAGTDAVPERVVREVHELGLASDRLRFARADAAAGFRDEAMRRARSLVRRTTPEDFDD